MSTELPFSPRQAQLLSATIYVPAVMDAVSIVQKLQQARKEWRSGFDSWVLKIPWEKEMSTNSVHFPGDPMDKELWSYSPQGCRVGHLVTKPSQKSW